MHNGIWNKTINEVKLVVLIQAHTWFRNKSIGQRWICNWIKRCWEVWFDCREWMGADLCFCSIGSGVEECAFASRRLTLQSGKRLGVGFTLWSRAPSRRWQHQLVDTHLLCTSFTPTFAQLRMKFNSHMTMQKQFWTNVKLRDYGSSQRFKGLEKSETWDFSKIVLETTESLVFAIWSLVQLL